VGDAARAPEFPDAARTALGNPQLRRNVRHATEVIRGKRRLVVGEIEDWQELREAGRQIKAQVLRHLDRYLEQFERACTQAGGHVHWARDADEANGIIVGILKDRGTTEIIKVKTMTSDETRLNVALEAAGITPYETDLADLIIQLGRDAPSHIVVPALHRNRHEIRELFMRTMGITNLGDDPGDLARAARAFLREKFLRVRTGFSGANFLIAETGGVCVVESEGNGRMCVTLPDTLITLAGIEKIVPTFADLEVFLQLLPRSATGERMNPYNSMWTGVTGGDGPREFHVVLLDNGRTAVLEDEAARSTLSCIRCAACLNYCPVYRQTGGHAYGSIYSGPIGAILTPQLQGMQHSTSLPYASSLCGACYEVCPVKIDIPEILIHLRRRIVEEHAPLAERAAMKAAAFTFGGERRLSMAHRAARLAQKPFARDGRLRDLPGLLRGWTATRDLPAMPKETFREWWARRTPNSRVPTPKVEIDDRSKS
jgi:L-lactate dehydrogenase complex protein LldF